MRKLVKGFFLLILAGWIVIQFVPVDRTNPPVAGEITAHDEVMLVLRTSCYDCHSNETRWPWYSRVAPVSWWMAQHVRMGRERLNFSEWQPLSPEEMEEARKEAWEEVERGSMPLPVYLRMHPEALLTEPQREALERWSQGREPGFPDWD